jgi:hypothetical protein
VWYDAFEFSSWTFTTDNVFFHIGERPGDPTETTMDFREMYTASGLTDRMSGQRWPTYELLSRGHTVVRVILWTEDEALFREHLEVEFGSDDSMLYYRAD